MVQVMTALVLVMELAVTALICAAGSAVVMNVKLSEVLVTPPELAETPAKLYVVPGVRPPRITVWVVWRIWFKVDSVP